MAASHDEQSDCDHASDANEADNGKGAGHSTGIGKETKRAQQMASVRCDVTHPEEEDLAAVGEGVAVTEVYTTTGDEEKYGSERPALAATFVGVEDAYDCCCTTPADAVEVDEVDGSVVEGAAEEDGML